MDAVSPVSLSAVLHCLLDLQLCSSDVSVSIIGIMVMQLPLGMHRFNILTEVVFFASLHQLCIFLYTVILK